MMQRNDPWVVVLAAGAGTRLQQLTVGDDGVAVPKQYCSLHGGRTLLVDTIGRARHVARRDRIVVVVAKEHERWWRMQLHWLPHENIVVQPQNRGTGPGIVLPLRHVLARDPAARVVVMPSDHHVDRSAVLVAALGRALRASWQAPDRLVVLGIEPDAPDGEYGWVLPGGGRSDGAGRAADTRTVQRFVEKPPAAIAAGLLRAGGLWNSFLFCAEGRTLWRLCESLLPETTSALAATTNDAELAAAYATLPPADFSRDVMQAAPERLLLLAVPECGWTDLGTPPRVAECLARLQQQAALPPRRPSWYPTVVLADRVAPAAAAAARTDARYAAASA